MNSQKVNFIPTYNGVPITDYTPADVELFFLDVIDMPEANKSWSMQIAASGSEVTGNITIYVGNSLDLDFAGYMEVFSFADTPIIVSASEFNYRYMRLELELKNGSVSISMVK